MNLTWGRDAFPHGLDKLYNRYPHPLKKQIIILLLGTIFFFTGIADTHAQVDQMQMDLLTYYELPLRWDNIEDRDSLVSGPHPSYSMEYGMHVITLEPGEYLKVKIPENTMLRVLSPDGCAPLDPLKFSISNGTGLQAFLDVPMTPERLSALIVPRTDDPTLCSIFLPAQAKECLKIALFTSRQEALSTLAPFRRLIPLAGESVSISQAKTPGTKKFWQTNTDIPGVLELEGPARIAIETRVLYPSLEQSRRIRYFLQVSMDDHPFATLNFETPPETSKKIFMDGTPLVCGRVQSAILNIPQGVHTLKIHPRADVIVRVLKQEDPDYLFSKLNAPKSYGATRDKLMSPGKSSPPKDKKDTRPTSPGLFEIEGTAQRMVRDNARPQAGLAGAFLMAQQAQKRPDAPVVKKIATDLYAAHTFFRDLLPYTKPGMDDQKSFRFILPRLKRAQDHNMTVATQHADKLYSLVQESAFVKIPTDEAQPLVYRFPKRTAPSRLRIIVKPQDASRNFFITFNNLSPETGPKVPVLTTSQGLSSQNPVPSTQSPHHPNPITLTISPCYEAPSNNFRISPAEAGLALNMLRHRPVSHLENNGDVHKKVLYLEPLIKPAFIEIPLPTDVDGFTLWGEDSAGMAAVQYLDSLPYRMSESEYLQAVKTAGPPRRLFKYFTAFLSSGQGEEATAITLEAMVKNDLKSHWTPLVRMIRANDALFSAGEGKLLPEPATKLSQTRITALTKKAGELEADHQPLPALERWSELFSHTTGKIRSDAAFKMVDQLILMGETYLAETLLKQLFLKSEPRVSDQAFQRLISFYQKGEADNKLLPLYSARAVSYPTPDNFKTLSEQLFKEGHFFHAMMLATPIPHPVRPTPLILKTAGRLGWFRVYVDLVKKLKRPEELAYWQGLGLLYQSQYEKALGILENAGKKGKTLNDSVMEGLAIKDLLFSRDREKRMQGILAWESWSRDLPGDHAWQNASHGVLDYDGAVMTYSEPRDLYSKAFRATPLKSVTARFYGPLRLKITARILHSPQDSLPVNGWFTVKHNGTNHGVPIVNDLAVQGLTMVGTKNFLPGRKIIREVQLAPGINEIQVDTRAIPLIATFDILRPVMPLSGVLPPLKIDTVEAIMKGDFKTSSGLLPNTPCNAILNDSVGFTPPNMGLEFFNKIIPIHSKNRFSHDPRHQAHPLYQSPPQSKGPSQDQFWGEKNIKIAPLLNIGIMKRHPKERVTAMYPMLNMELPGLPPMAQRKDNSNSKMSSSLFTPPSLQKIFKIEPVLNIERLRQSMDKNNLPPCTPGDTVNVDDPLQSGPSSRAELACDFPRPIQHSYFPISPISRDALDSKRQDISMDKKQNLPVYKNAHQGKEKTVEKMMALVKLAKENPEDILSIEADARQLFSNHSHLSGLGSLLGQITRNTTWKPVSMVQANAGITPIPLETWHPESETLRVRKSLFPKIFMGEQVITKENDLVFFMNNTKPVVINATISTIDLSILQPAPVKFFYQIDDHPPELITLIPGLPDHRISKHVDRGEHRLTLGIVESYANQFLKVKFCEKTLSSDTCADLELDKIPQRSFYTATQQEPVMVNILGPAWIRIDQQKQNETWIRHQYIKKGWQRLVLAPAGDEKEALFRIHQRWVKHNPPEPPPARPVKINYDSLPAPHQKFESEKPVEHIWFQDVYPLGSQEDGTWSLSGSYKKPFKVQEDNDVESQDHRYEVSATHYYHDNDLPGYFKTSFLGRFKEKGGPTLGILEDFFYYPRQSSLGFNINASVYMQRPDADNFDFFQSVAEEYAGLVKARIFQKRSLGPRSFHTPSFSLFGRVLSMDNSDEYPDHPVDNDLFSTYKNDHKTGAGLSDYAAFSPWLDTLWFLQGGIHSNENFNLLSPDNVKIQVGWKQLIGNLTANTKFRHTYYFSDDDRDNDIKRNHVDLDLLWNQWMPDQRRLTLGLELSHDLDNNESSILFSLSWFFSRGRGLKDIRPGELDFYSIHQRNIPQTDNNQIWTD